MAIIGALALGKTETIVSETASIAGSKSVDFTVESDSILISVYAEVVSGSLSISVYTLTDNGKEVAVINFPVLTAPTSELLLKKAAAVMSRVKVVATYSGATTFEVRARGINAGETSVKLLGSSSGKASQVSVGTTPMPLFPVSLQDRAGLIVKNNSNSGILYIGYSIGEAVVGNGYPIGAGESLGIDIGSGVIVYARSDVGTLDIRLMESGS